MDKTQVFNQDCLEAMQSYPTKYFDLAIVDPPYRDENQPTQGMRRNGKMDSIIGRPTQHYWNELYRVSKNQIIWGANNFQLPPFKGFVIWKKLNISEDFTMSMCELASISEGLGTISKWIEIAPQDPDRIHPTQKPIKLYKWLLKNYAKKGDKLLDTHLGSQSSRIAAFDMGFDFTGYELDKDYFEAGSKRFAQHVSQFKLFTPEQEQAKPQLEIPGTEYTKTERFKKLAKEYLENDKKAFPQSYI